MQLSREGVEGKPMRGKHSPRTSDEKSEYAKSLSEIMLGQGMPENPKNGRKAVCNEPELLGIEKGFWVYEN